MNPKISIVIPCYNMGEFIEETINSVISYPSKSDYEIIVVNDGSNNKHTIKILEKLKQNGIYIIDQDNQGLAKARNNGIKLAKGKFILPLDADNKIRHIYISRSIEIFETNSEVAIIYGNKQHFDEDDKLVNVPEFNFPLLCEKNYIDACACYTKELWEKLNGYDENMPVMGYEDWDFWLRASLIGAKFYKINKTVFDYRVRGNSMISNTNQKYNLITNYIYSKKELNVIESIGNTNKQASALKHIKASMEYKLGSFILAPIRYLQKLF